MELWNQSTEMDFFEKSKDFSSVDKLFYKSDEGKYYAYWPKEYKGKKSTLQSRNSLIGNFTETWCQSLFKPFIEEMGLYANQGIVCNELGLSRQSDGDLAICKTNNKLQKPEDILIIFEVKMSIVWNWLLNDINDFNSLVCIGDYKTHKGNPGLLRSDSMLKAIGKSINIRVSSYKASKIPIIILGNTPITKNYYEKVDFLKKSGIIQSFWSLNPNPITSSKDSSDNLKMTNDEGFHRIDDIDELKSKIEILINEDFEFFSSMKSKKELGEIVEIANIEETYEKKGEKFLTLLRA